MPLIVPDQPETRISASLGTALLRIPTDHECVMSSWWFAQAGSGEAAVEDVVAVLELAWTSPDGGDQVVGVGEGSVRQAGASKDGPEALDWVEVGCVGRQLEDGEPVTVGDVMTHPGGQVGVEDAPMLRQVAEDAATEVAVGWICRKISRAT